VFTTALQHYLYADGASAPAAGSKATVTSPLFDPSAPVCVDFYYHMYGVGEGSLSLNIKVSVKVKTLVINIKVR
jgi:hypothetical protein